MRYFSPLTLNEAHNLLLKYPGAKPLAGGTDLIVEKRSGKLNVNVIVDLKRIEGLDRIVISDNTVEIGAMVTVNKLLKEFDFHNGLEALKDAAQVFGCYEIRNRATIGGNIVHASPGAEFASTLVALDSYFRIFGSDGEIEVPADKFFTGVGKCILKDGDILTSIVFQLHKNSSSAYTRASRVDGMDLAIVNCAICVKKKERNIMDVRVCFGAVAEKPLRLNEVENILQEKCWDKENIFKCKEILIKKLSPREESLRAKPFSKKILAGNLLEEALEKVKERLQLNG